MDQTLNSSDNMQSPNVSGAASGPQPVSNANPTTRPLSPTRPTIDSNEIEKRPTFGQWVKSVWPDILTMGLIGAFAFPVYYLARPMGRRVFPLDDESTSQPVSVMPSGLAYPARRQMVSNWLVAIVSIVVPLAIILLLQSRIRNFWDLNNSLLGFFYALVISSAFQAITKTFVGGLRPNFYDVCQPDISRANGGGIGFRQQMWSDDVCTTSHSRRLRNAMQSFPSGHATTMTAAMVYLCLYLNAKLKIFGNHHTPLWKLALLALPLLGAMLLYGSLIIDNTHHWYDILAGAIIGALAAFAAFRMVYPSIFNWRTNHIPLSRTVPFNGSSRPDLVATKRAGWGSPVAEGNGASAPGAAHAGLEEGVSAGSGVPNRAIL